MGHCFQTMYLHSLMEYAQAVKSIMRVPQKWSQNILIGPWWCATKQLSKIISALLSSHYRTGVGTSSSWAAQCCSG